MSGGEVGRALAAFVAVIDDLAIPWLVGGSLASSVHGAGRSTLDVDMVLAIVPSAVRPLVRALEPDFYVEEGAVRDAVRAQSSFNVIHNATIVKIDAYILTSDPFEQSAFSRGVMERVPGVGPPSDVFRFCSAEDIVLFKLRWYRLGAEVSERQWLDVLGVLKLAGPRLDMAYLQRWAAHVGVSDLLVRALRDAGLGAA